ncbi:alpha-L-rhamnosidase [Alteromonas sp. KUL49]|uniref:alpha-L-rhamnosidase n=1 Tax=Alteromonas sp. KUL49 TaxID=2480798 RepID=UPI00102EE98E|nr:alpha-L-rhamnosidase [Alteromonas sp. KUL49]TAP37315.1 rhamnosidase [Alteromonas sp. KUL49]GEA12938.1 alpha-L-rhamnosidase [Alteromonas sp. KUL49]
MRLLNHNLHPTTCLAWGLLFVFFANIGGCKHQQSVDALLSPAPIALKVNEGFVEPLGFYDAKPRFSWRLPSNGKALSQGAYQVLVASSERLLLTEPDLWDSGKQHTSQSTFVLYEGAPLMSRQRVFWRVRYWNEAGDVSEWSVPSSIELGLLANSDWQAQWIEIQQDQPVQLDQFETPIHIPQYLRKGFTVSGRVKKARLYVTAKGVFIAYLNGQRIGEDVLTPGYTPYDTRIETLTYDVTQQLREGSNALGLQLAEGWYAGRFGPKRHWHKKREITPQAIAQLEIEFEDGTTTVITTDNRWRASQQGPVRSSELYDGESYDANFDFSGAEYHWSDPRFNDNHWQGVQANAIDNDILLQPKRHFTSVNKQLLPAIAITQIDDKIVYDLGQNMVGVVRIQLPMREGQTLTMKFAEGVNPDGSIYTRNLGSARQTDTYTASEDGIVEWQPQFTFHGFRYVEISGFDTSVTPQLSWLTGVVQYTDFELTGNLNTSNTALNQLQSNIEWGLKGNFLDIPTDCPQRSERLGWTGDALAFTPTSLFIADSHGFWAAWLQSVREEQFDNHGVPVVVPNEVGDIVQAGWSDAAVTIPWDVYWRTGDVQILRDNYDMMKRWITYHEGQLEEGISTMWTVGDWLQPYSTREDSRRGETDHSLISTAFYARSLDITARTARVLGEVADSQRYRDQFNQVKQVFQSYFFDHDGKLKVGEQTQTAYLLAIGFDLLDEQMTLKSVRHLLSQFDIAGGHLRTGFLGTPLIAPVLEKVGRADVAFDLVFKESYPSWLFSITQGATTMWERWDGYTHENGYAKRAGSLNHYAYGAIGQWLYDRMAGISPIEAGYKKIRIAPLVTEYLTFAEANYMSLFGEIRSSWTRNAGGLIMEVTIPPNSRAVIEIPQYYYKKSSTLTEQKQEVLGTKISINGQSITSAADVTLLSASLATTSIEVGSGDYKIEVVH